MKKVLHSLLALGTALAGTTYADYKPGISRSTKVARFDFMCAIEEADLSAVEKYLAEGLDVNERLGGPNDTLLMYAIRKLAAETENKESIGLNTLYALYGIGGLAGLGYGALRAKPYLSNYIDSFKDDHMNTLRERWKESAIYPVVGITAFGAALFFVSSSLSNFKKVISYMYFLWKTSQSRLMIIERLIKHPSIDLAIRNEIKNKDGLGQTALDVTRELKKKVHSSYISNLLDIVAVLIEERMKSDTAKEPIL